MSTSTIILIGALVLFMLPSILVMSRERKRQQHLKEFQASLTPGKRVISGSGIYGTVVEVSEETDTVELEIAPGVQVTMARAGILRSQG